MLHAIQAFGMYFLTSITILAMFAYLYVKLTPWQDLELIRDGYTAPAITLAGALIGFTLPICSVILHTGHLQEMITWSIISSFVQSISYTVSRIVLNNRLNHLMGHEVGVPSAIVLASISVVLGLFTAACVIP